jgi:FkbM family methyltransferase
MSSARRTSADPAKSLRRAVARLNAKRRVLRGRARRLRWDLRVAIRRALGVAPPDPLGKVMFAFARARPGAFVVQIGAHDATQLDPIRRYITTRGWRGILVEPIPDVFERLKQTYAGTPGLVFENVAIAEMTGTMELHYIPTDHGLHQWYDALASFSRDVLLSHKELIPDIEDRVASMEVPTLTFNDLCERHGVQQVDVVQIDTEGYDLEVLKLIDLGRYRPAIVQFEELHLDADARQEARSLLARHGYESAGNEMDCLALAPRLLHAKESRVLATWKAAVAELKAKRS